MRVFKYKPIGENFERDIKTTENNQFWASTLDNLNDPCEALTDKSRINKLFKWIASLININSPENIKFINQNTEDVLNVNGKFGIFSLSKTYLDELLWAHYSESHKGYCLEYDLDILMESDGHKGIFSFPVKYKKKPPKIIYKDIISDYNPLIRKWAFYKPKRWSYEKEHRIVTSKLGANSYYYKALKAVYFGLRIDEKNKNEILKLLSGRGIDFYQIEQIPNTYNFRAIKLKNSSEKENYLKLIPEDISKKKISFRVIYKKIHNNQGIAEFKIRLEEKINIEQLKEFSKYLKRNLMPDGIAVFLTFYLSGDSNESEWAYCSYTNKNWVFETTNGSI